MTSIIHIRLSLLIPRYFQPMNTFSESFSLLIIWPSMSSRSADYPSSLLVRRRYDDMNAGNVIPSIYFFLTTPSFVTRHRSPAKSRARFGISRKGTPADTEVQTKRCCHPKAAKLVCDVHERTTAANIQDVKEN